MNLILLILNQLQIDKDNRVELQIPPSVHPELTTPRSGGICKTIDYESLYI
jgi:hypothetical protein